MKNRMKRAGKCWFKLKKQLVGSKEASRVVEACVESALLFNCHVRVWYVKELKRLQSFMDKIYTYIWSEKTKLPLIQMQEESKNMADVWKDLGVKSIRCKVEKRVLERIGHVMRMKDNRMTKAVTLGWMKEAEKYKKPKGRKRETVTCWKKLVREAGMDTTDIGSLTADRKNWKAKVKERMKHLLQWEESKRKRWAGAAVVWNLVREEVPEFKCEVCGRVCVSKGGLVNHRRRIHHEVSKQKKMFRCKKCDLKVDKEASLRNHMKVCGRAKASVPGGKRCVCGKEYSKSYFRRHRNSCGVTSRRSSPAQPGPAVGKSEVHVRRHGREDKSRKTQKTSVSE